MTRLLCVRHAESEWNAQGRWQGQADPPLSERGRRDAAAAAPRLNGDIARIATSDLARAKQTAEIIATVLGIPHVVDEPGLREIDVGEWSGMTRDEIEARWPGSIEGWRTGRSSPAGAEDRLLFLDRIRQALDRVAASDNRPALVVTHAGTIVRLERHLGVHPGTPLPMLSGRWLEAGAGLRVVGDRVYLLDH